MTQFKFRPGDQVYVRHLSNLRPREIISCFDAAGWPHYNLKGHDGPVSQLWLSTKPINARKGH